MQGLSTVTGSIVEGENMSSENGELSNDLPEQPTEKMLPQSEVNRLVGGVKTQSKQELSKAQQEIEALRAQLESQPKSMGGITYNPDEIVRQATEAAQRGIQEQLAKEREEAQRKAQEQYANDISARYAELTKDGPEIYEDWNEVMQDFDYENLYNVPLMAMKHDNTRDLMYTLQKNPAKLATLVSTMNVSPKAAENWLKELSTSLKQSKSGSTPSVNAPLSQLKPSQAAADNGRPSIRDLKKKYRV